MLLKKEAAEMEFSGRIYPPMRRRQSGFSLLETVLVIAIVATLTAVAVPRYAGTSGHYRAELAARRVLGDLNWVATRARSIGKKRVVIFDQAGNSYRIVTEEDPQISDRSLENLTVEIGDRPYHAEIVTASFGDDERVVFDAYGRSDSGGIVRVQSGRFVKTVVLNAISSKAEIQ